MPEAIRERLDRRAADRRRPEALATRRRLLRVGRRAFARKGLAGANLRDDVLAPAGVSVGSFYHQFADKTDLLLAVLAEGEQRQARRRAALRDPPPAASRADLAERFFELLLGWARRNPDLWRIGLRERAGEVREVRRALAQEREAWERKLSEALAVLSGRRLPPAQRANWARWWVRLGYGAADERALAGSRGGSGPGAPALAAVAVAGCRALGRDGGRSGR